MTIEMVIVVIFMSFTNGMIGYYYYQYMNNCLLERILPSPKKREGKLNENTKMTTSPKEFQTKM